MKIFQITCLLACMTLLSCQNSQEHNSSSYKTIGSIEVLNERLKEVIDPNAKIEILASGFNWSEGPLWVEELNSLVFSDVPGNKVYSWNEKDSIQLLLSPSGFTNIGAYSDKQGSNGLALDNSGNLILCQHGDRRVASYDLSNPSEGFKTITATFNGLQFNSPNDLALSDSNNIYFTDPPYGLKDQDEDSVKQLPFNGVYLFDAKRQHIELIDSTLTRPNGIALSPNEKYIIVANSDPDIPIWRKYDLTKSAKDHELLFNASHLVESRHGMPDGLKINRNNIIFATGPGGVLILDMNGDHLGSILTTKHTANCALSPDEKTLYMTADDLLLRVSLK